MNQNRKRQWILILIFIAFFLSMSFLPLLVIKSDAIFWSECEGNCYTSFREMGEWCETTHKSKGQQVIDKCIEVFRADLEECLEKCNEE